MFVKLFLVDQKALNKHKTPGTVHATSKANQVETREDPTKHGKPSGGLAGTKRKLVEPSGQHTEAGEQMEPARKITREMKHAKLSESERLGFFAEVAAALSQLLEKQAEPGEEEVTKRKESIEPGGEVDYDNLVIRPVYETTRRLSCRGIDAKTLTRAEVLCESYVQFRSSNTLVRDNTCPR